MTKVHLPFILSLLKKSNIKEMQMLGKISMDLSFCQSEQEFSLDELVLRILEPLSSPCRAWRKNGQTVSSGYECPGQRDFISWWSAPWLSTRTSGGVSVRNLCTPVTCARRFSPLSEKKSGRRILRQPAGLTFS